MDVSRTIAVMAAPIYAAKQAAHGHDTDGVSNVIMMRAAVAEAWELWRLARDMVPRSE